MSEVAEPGEVIGGVRARTNGGLKGTLAIVAIALAVLFAVLYRIDNSREDHSYNSGAMPPATVRITEGKQYEISTPGGPKPVAARIGPSAELNCNYTPTNGSSTDELDTTRLDSGTRTTHAVATFIGPVSGPVHIECRTLTATFVDDADDVSGDPAGAFLLLGTVSLTVGVMLGLSTLYQRHRPPSLGDSDESGGDGPGDEGDYRHLLASPTDS